MILLRSQGSGRASERSQEGAISIMAAVLAVAMIMATSLAVDVGRVAYTSRDQQGATDRAVLDALGELAAIHHGATGPQAVWQGVRREILESLARNRGGSSIGTSSERAIRLLEVGYVDDDDQFHVMWRDDPDEYVMEPELPEQPDPEVPKQGRAGPVASSWGSQPIDTIRLSTHSTVEYVFGILADGKREVHRQAMGTTDPTGTPAGCPPPLAPGCLPTPPDAEATISVGSRLVEFDSSSSAVLGPLLASLFGTPTALTLVGHDGLLTADVPLGVLGAAGAEVGTVDSLLASTDIHVAELVDAAISGLDKDDEAVRADVEAILVKQLQGKVDPALTFDVDQVLTATTQDPGALLAAEVPVLDLLVAGALSAQARLVDGENLFKLDLDLGGLPLVDTLGATGLSLGLTVLERPQFAHGPARWKAEDQNGDGLVQAGEGRYETSVETAQVALSLELDARESVLGGLLDGVSTITESLLDGLGLCGVLSFLCPDDEATLHVSLSAAEADAQLVAIDCQQPAEDSDISGLVSSQAVRVKAGLLSTSLLDVGVGGGAEEAVAIDHVPGSASTSGGSALQGLELLTDLGLATVLDPVLALLGIQLGTGQMSVHAVQCDSPVLLPNR